MANANACMYVGAALPPLTKSDRHACMRYAVRKTGYCNNPVFELTRQYRAGAVRIYILYMNTKSSILPQSMHAWMVTFVLGLFISNAPLAVSLVRGGRRSGSLQRNTHIDKRKITMHARTQSSYHISFRLSDASGKVELSRGECHR